MGPVYEVEVTIVSAQNLINIDRRRGSCLKPYAVVWVDDPSNKLPTRVDEVGGRHPHWDQKLVIPFNSPVITDSTYLNMDIFHAKPTEATLLGSAQLPLLNLHLRKLVLKKLNLITMSGRPHGTVDVQVFLRKTKCYHAPTHPYYQAQPNYPQRRGLRDYSAAPRGLRDYSAAPPIYGGAPQVGTPYQSYDQPAYGYPAGDMRVGTRLAVVHDEIELAKDVIELAEKVEDDWDDGGDDGGTESRDDDDY